MRHKARLAALFTLAAALLVAPAVFGAQDGVGVSNFPYRAEIEGKTVKNRLYRVTLDAGVLEKCGRDCKKARIFDSAGREIPFVILEERAVQGRPESHPLEVVSLDEKKGVKTITLKRGPQATEMVNRMDVTTGDRDFHKLVIITGSDDRTRWERVGQDSIYDFSSQVGLRHTTIELKENKYRFYQFIMKNLGERPSRQKLRLRYEGLDLTTDRPADGNISLSGFAVSYQKEGREETIYDEAVISPAITHDDKQKTTEVLIDTALPAETVVFGIGNPYYLRTVVVYGSKTGKKEDMVRLCGTTVYNLSIAGKKEIKDLVDIQPAAGYRYYRIVIEDKANPPLRLEKVAIRWVRKQLFFFALDDEQRYWLYAGAASSRPSSYDIAAVIRADNPASRSAQPLGIGPVIANSDYKPSTDVTKKARTERFILISVVMLLVLVAGFFLYHLWKKASNRGGQGNIPRSGA